MSVALPIQRNQEAAKAEESEQVVGRAASLEPAAVQLFVASPEDAPSILLEVHEGTEDAGRIFRLLGLAPRRNAEISAIRHPGAFDPAEVAYPKLFAGSDQLAMSSEELADELDLIGAMGWPKSFDQPYVYGAHVLTPRDYRFRADPSKYGPLLALHAIRSEIAVGHLRHETLYECDPALRPELLRDFLAGARSVRISLQRPSGCYSTVDVEIV